MLIYEVFPDWLKPARDHFKHAEKSANCQTGRVYQKRFNSFCHEKTDPLFIVATHILIAFFFSSTIVLKLLKTAEGIRKLLDTVAEALPQVSGSDTGHPSVM